MDYYIQFLYITLCLLLDLRYSDTYHVKPTSGVGQRGEIEVTATARIIIPDEAKQQGNNVAMPTMPSSVIRSKKRRGRLKKFARKSLRERRHRHHNGGLHKRRLPLTNPHPAEPLWESTRPGGELIYSMFSNPRKETRSTNLDSGENTLGSFDDNGDDIEDEEEDNMPPTGSTTDEPNAIDPASTNDVAPTGVTALGDVGTTVSTGETGDNSLKEFKAPRNQYDEPESIYYEDEEEEGEPDDNPDTTPTDNPTPDPAEEAETKRTLKRLFRTKQYLTRRRNYARYLQLADRMHASNSPQNSPHNNYYKKDTILRDVATPDVDNAKETLQQLYNSDEFATEDQNYAKYLRYANDEPESYGTYYYKNILGRKGKQSAVPTGTRAGVETN